jgi:hypothetical protein
VAASLQRFVDFVEEDVGQKRRVAGDDAPAK